MAKKRGFVLDVTLVIGIILAFGLNAYAIGLEYIVDLFWNPPSLIIVLGGVTAAAHLQFPDTQFKKVFSRLKVAFSMKQTQNFKLDIEFISELGKKVRVQGIESIQPDVDLQTDHFIKSALQLLVDKITPHDLELILLENIKYIQKRHSLGILFFETAGKYAPAFGLFGTVVGLIKLLADLSSPELFGQSMAMAMVTTFYGLLFSYLVFNPIAGRLKVLSYEESLQKEMLLVGIMALANNDAPYVIKEKMQMFLTDKERRQLWKNKD